MRGLVFAVLLLPGLAPGAAARSFDFARDTFAFANDTLRSYSWDAAGVQRAVARDKAPMYARHCLVLVRATLQFWKFARFEPRGRPADQMELQRRVRMLARIPAWLPARAERIEFTGFKDLREFSEAHPGLLQANLGVWWPTYWRPGNWRMALPFPRVLQAHLARQLEHDLAGGTPQAVFVTRFRPLNHALVLFGCVGEGDGSLRFLAYDPNNAVRPVVLRFDARQRSFILEKTAYWKGGRVNVFRLYTGLPG